MGRGQASGSGGDKSIWRRTSVRRGWTTRGRGRTASQWGLAAHASGVGRRASRGADVDGGKVGVEKSEWGANGGRVGESEWR